MQVANIVAGVNTKLAGETLTYNQLRLFLDDVVDIINRELNAKFPSFDELTISDSYTAIPDKYIRSVIIIGAAYKFYVTDEEGISTAVQYQRDFLENLFFMKRDYSHLVPEEYQAEDQGFVNGLDEDGNITTCWGGW